MKAKEEGNRVSKFTLHERTPKVYRCTFPFGRAAVKRITRGPAKEVELNFGQGASNKLLQRVGQSCVASSKILVI